MQRRLWGCRSGGCLDRIRDVVLVRCGQKCREQPLLRLVVIDHDLGMPLHAHDEGVVG